MLYQAEIKEQLPSDVLRDVRKQGWIPSASRLGEPPGEVAEYATRLVEGVQNHAAEIDGLISQHADHWSLDRMPVVDKNLLRIAAFELFWTPDVPAAVVINEAVEMAKALSTDDSGRFINGVMGRLVELRAEGGSPG